MVRKRTYSRGSLISQMIAQDAANMGVNAILSDELDELNHRSSDVVLKKCVLDLMAWPQSPGNHGTVKHGILSKPKTDGVPTSSDFLDERLVVHQCQVTCRQDTTFGTFTGDQYHVSHPMKIKVPLDYRVYSVLWAVNAAMTAVYWLRVFWTII